MRAEVVILRDAFRAAPPERRVVRRRARIRSLVPPGPHIAVLNGEVLPRLPAGALDRLPPEAARDLLRRAPGWRRRLADGDHLLVMPVPLGGQGGSDPVRALLSLALAAVAGPLGGAIGGLLGGGAFWSSAASLAVLFGGQALINALLPPPVPDRLPAPGQVFSLSPQGNVARLEQPVPVQYGRLRFAPDFAAAPWAETAGNEQYLYLLYCLGAGAFEIERIEIGEVPIAAFGEIETEVVPPGAEVTLFPTAVETSVLVSGQELRGRVEASFTRSGSVLTVAEEGHRRASGQTVRLTRAGEPVVIAQIGTIPDENSWTVEAPGWTASSGTLSAETVLGGLTGFPANAAGTRAAAVGVDLVWPMGLHRMNSEGELKARSTTVRFEARRIDDSGNPLGGWMLLGEETLRDRTRTPQRRSWRYPLPVASRWAVRAWRTDVRSSDAAAAHDVHWGGLRGYLVGDQDWPAVTLLAVRMRSTGNLARQAERRLFVTATRKLPVWDGAAWSAPQPTRSIAWALADMARNPDYGPGLPDAQIDLAGLRELDALWAARGDACDIRLAEAMGWWEAAGRVAATGRARPVFQAGRLRIVRDGPETVPVAMFSQRNIVRGSFGIDWLKGGRGRADAVEVSYLDGATWRPERVMAQLAGASADRPATIRLDGVTHRAQALREGLYHAACNRYRRRMLRFSTEMEGFIPAVGDLIAVQHDMPGWGAQAEARAWDAAERRLRVSERLDWSGTGHVVGLRRRDGSVAGPFPCVRGAADDEIELLADPGMPIDTGQGRERTHVAFGRGAAWSALAKVAAIRPRDAVTVEVEAVVEDPAVHVAETGRTPAPLRPGRLPALAEAPALAGLTAVIGPSGDVFLSWAPAAGATHYEIEVAEGRPVTGAAGGWTRAGETTATAFVVRAIYAPWTRLRVRAIGRSAGPWAEAQTGLTSPPVWYVLEDAGREAVWADIDTDTVWEDIDTDTVWENLDED